jgi:hypothetical protein
LKRTVKAEYRAAQDAAPPPFVHSASYRRGFAAFADYIAACVAQAPPGWSGAAWFILAVSEECANLRLQDLWRPWRFLAQAATPPPLCFGPHGFAPHLVDDLLPARHYVAFLFVGFWLPRALAWVTLYLWEIAGFLRYGLRWSTPDLHLGLLGLRHGALVARYGPTILPALLAADLAAEQNGDVVN